MARNPTRRRLPLWSYAAGALAVVVALAVVQVVVPSAMRPAGPQSTNQAAPGALRILPLGDSVTYGYEFGSYRTRLRELLTADGYEIDFVGSMSDGPADLPDREHEGHRGWRIGQLEERAAGWVQEHDPDVVLLHVGTNDLLQGASAQEAAAGLDSLLGSLAAAKPEMTVIVSTLIPLHEGDQNWQQTNAAFADLVAEHAAAGERVTLADMSRGGPRPGDQIPDGVHPNGAGYALMADVWYPAVVQALGRYTTSSGQRGGEDDRCRWYAAAIRLAQSIEGVDDPRAEDIRAELERLGITAGTRPPPECEEGTGNRRTAPEETTPGDQQAEPPRQNAPSGGIGRIALSADGNQHDEDDWASSAMTLAILAHSNLQRNVVSYTYNDHIWDSATEHRRNMTTSVMQGGERFRFDTSRFFDSADPQERRAGVQNLAREINRSRPGNELWLVLAGPMEMAWMALDAANPQARRSVKCVSHGNWNENHGADDHGGHRYEDLIELGCQRYQLPDQNGELGKTGMSDWDYLNELGANMRWLHSRIELLGNGDVSDAGMVYYVITGTETGTRSDLRSYFQGEPARPTPPGSPSGTER